MPDPMHCNAEKNVACCKKAKLIINHQSMKCIKVVEWGRVEDSAVGQ